MKCLIIGISGASGVIYGIRMLEVLKELGDVETHLIISKFGRLNIDIEAPPTQSTSWGARLFQLRDPDGVPVTFLEWSET